MIRTVGRTYRQGLVSSALYTDKKQYRVRVMLAVCVEHESFNLDMVQSLCSEFACIGSLFPLFD